MPPEINTRISAAISRLGMKSDRFGQYAMLPRAISLLLLSFEWRHRSMRIMRKLVVLTIIGLSTLVVLDNAQANEQIQSEKFAGELTESSVRKWIDSVEYAVAAALPQP